MSAALVEWRTTRSGRLDNLVRAHRAITGGTTGRKWLTTGINHSLILRLASEYQGYCRDLHDEAIDAVLSCKCAADQAMSSVVRALLETGRKLDSGNANWGNIGSDFARFGVSVADELKSRHAKRYPGWTPKLDRLNAARNAISHDDRLRLAEIEPLTLGTFRIWRSASSAVASGLDAALGAYLSEFNGVDPW